jgi:hypothetical protein
MRLTPGARRLPQRRTNPTGYGKPVVDHRHGPAIQREQHVS